MKEQISSFIKTPLEFEIDFPEGYSSTFEEIDVAFKIGTFLILLEVKGSSISQEFFYDTLQFIENNTKELERLDKKCIMLKNALKEKMIKHDFFEDVNIDNISGMMVRNEGIYGIERICNFNDFKYWVEEMIRR